MRIVTISVIVGMVAVILFFLVAVTLLYLAERVMDTDKVVRTEFGETRIELDNYYDYEFEAEGLVLVTDLQSDSKVVIVNLETNEELSNEFYLELMGVKEYRLREETQITPGKWRPKSSGMMFVKGESRVTVSWNQGSYLEFLDKTIRKSIYDEESLLTAFFIGFTGGIAAFGFQVDERVQVKRLEKLNRQPAR